jgi:hypothetical protein
VIGFVHRLVVFTLFFSLFHAFLGIRIHSRIFKSFCSDEMDFILLDPVLSFLLRAVAIPGQRRRGWFPPNLRMARKYRRSRQLSQSTILSLYSAILIIYCFVNDNFYKLPCDGGLTRGSVFPPDVEKTRTGSDQGKTRSLDDPEPTGWQSWGPPRTYFWNSYSKSTARRAMYGRTVSRTKMGGVCSPSQPSMSLPRRWHHSSSAKQSIPSLSRGGAEKAKILQCVDKDC